MNSKPPKQLLTLSQAEIAAIYAALLVAEDYPDYHQDMIRDTLTSRQASEVNLSHLKDKINHRMVEIVPRAAIIFHEGEIESITGADSGEIMLLNTTDGSGGLKFLSKLPINRLQWAEAVKAYKEALEPVDDGNTKH